MSKTHIAKHSKVRTVGLQASHQWPKPVLIDDYTPSVVPVTPREGHQESPGSLSGWVNPVPVCPLQEGYRRTEPEIPRGSVLKP
jgi:hypothetical protein